MAAVDSDTVYLLRGAEVTRSVLLVYLCVPDEGLIEVHHHDQTPPRRPASKLAGCECCPPSTRSATPVSITSAIAKQQS